MTNPDLFVSAAYVLYVIAPAIRDELWLRTALFFNSVGFAVWGLWIGSWPVVVANALFCVMSLRQMQRAWDDKRPADLDEESATLGSALFPAMAGRDLERLWKAGDSLIGTAELTRLGEEPDSLYLVLDGQVRVELADGTVLLRNAPAVVGEVTTLSPHISEATATVTVTDGRVWKWSKAQLAELQQERPTMAAPFLQGLSAKMADRVRREPEAQQIVRVS